jgi:hypothetical protein
MRGCATSGISAVSNSKSLHEQRRSDNRTVQAGLALKRTNENKISDRRERPPRQASPDLTCYASPSICERPRESLRRTPPAGRA